MSILTWASSGLKAFRESFKDEDGYYPLFSRLYSSSPQFNDYTTDRRKLEVIFSNPALLKVVCLQCDLFSLGKIYIYKGDVEQDKDPLLQVFKKPNPFQYQSQLLWDYMFWVMVGNGYLYVDSNVPTAENKLYFLDPSKMEWPQELIKAKDKLIFSNQTEAALKKYEIKYTYEDGTTTSIPLSKITHISDLTNGVGNWFKSPSRIDALYKIISNSEEALDASNINLNFSKKFLVAGQADPKKTDQLPMNETEKQDIESKMNGRKKVHAIKSMIDIKRFVEDMRSLELGKAYLEQYYLIGSMYNIPRDVLEAYTSSTFENQEKARAGHVSYTLEPKGTALFEPLSDRFGYMAAGKEICISWDHLPFVQVFEFDRAKTKNMNIQTMQAMLKMKMDLSEVNQYLDTDFKTGEYEQPTKPVNTGAGAGN